MFSEHSLQKIRDCYLQIKLLTEQFLLNPTEEGISELLEDRSNLLSSISQYYNEGSLKQESNPLAQEIKWNIKAIIEMDRKAGSYIQNRMDEISTELSSLQKTSSAAKAYALHVR